MSHILNINMIDWWLIFFPMNFIWQATNKVITKNNVFALLVILSFANITYTDVNRAHHPGRHYWNYTLGALSPITAPHFDRLVQERCNSIATTLELRLSCTNPSIWS